ncbi:MAG TPA: hypothetical protein VGH90_11170 [Chthoniobacteraceae bacterium]|jgi:hypothetical protein
MSSRLSIAAALLFVPVLALADDANAVKFAGYHLANKSSFAPAAGSRTPFWPIGWMHKEGAAAVQVVKPKVVLDPQMFNVSSILLANPPPLAVINGRSYQEGELIRVRKGKDAQAGKLAVPTNVNIRVLKIEDGKVTIGTDSQTLILQMHQQDLPSHKGEDSDAEAALATDAGLNVK